MAKKEKRTPQEIAYNKGYYSQLNKEPQDINPYHEGSGEYYAWQFGYWDAEDGEPNRYKL